MINRSYIGCYRCREGRYRNDKDGENKDNDKYLLR